MNPARFQDLRWVLAHDAIDGSELSNPYRIAPLGEKSPDDLRVAFSNGRASEDHSVCEFRARKGFTRSSAFGA